MDMLSPENTNEHLNTQELQSFFTRNSPVSALLFDLANEVTHTELSETRTDSDSSAEMAEIQLSGISTGWKSHGETCEKGLSCRNEEK